MTAFFCAVQMPNRDVPMTSFEDTRVDICLYFIAPHALLPADVATIQRLGRTVPIVPIISKVPMPAPQDPTLHTGSRRERFVRGSRLVQASSLPAGVFATASNV